MEITLTGESLESVSDTLVVDALENDGKLVIRGANASVAGFHDFAHRFAKDFLSQAAEGFRDTLAPDVSTVVKGNMRLDLHMERGYSPIKPELCFFLAIASGTSGGEMLFGDGEKLLAALPTAIADKFRTKRLVYKPRFGPETWIGRYGTREQVEETFSKLPSIRAFRFTDDNVLEYEHVISGILPSRRSGAPAFLNNLILVWQNMQNMLQGRDVRVARGVVICFEDEEQIPPEMIQSILDAMDPVTERVALAPGDVAVCDNYQFMHGRTGFTGDRKAAAAFGARNALFKA